MSKVNVRHFSVGPVYMFIIDDKGQIWRRAVESSTWVRAGEVPDVPVSADPQSLNIQDVIEE